MQIVTLIHEENGVFGASFPDFLGCTTVADSLDAIIPKAAEALAFHVEGMIEDGPLPPVRTLMSVNRLAPDPSTTEPRFPFFSLIGPKYSQRRPAVTVRLDLTL